MSATRVPYKKSDFAKSLDDDELKIFCKVLEDLKCSIGPKFIQMWKWTKNVNPYNN